MCADRLLRLTTVAQLLRVDQETMRIWNHEGFLPVATRLMNMRHYTVESVNELLLRGARNFGSVPTVDDLLAGRLKLLLAEEAVAMIGTSSYWVMLQRVTSGRLAAIKLVAQMRYSQQSIEQYLQASSKNGQDLIPRAKVLHVLGISLPTLGELLSEGLLCDAAVSDNLHLRPITRASLLQTLWRLLPSWIDPRDWLDDRLCSSEPLVTAPQALKILQQNHAGLRRLMDDKALLYIYKPARRNWLFLPESLAAYLENEPVISRREIALQFGVAPRTVDSWAQNGLLVCDALGHTHGEEWDFTRTCLLAMLDRALTRGGGVSPRTWYDWRLAYRADLLAANEMAAALGCKYNDVIALAESGLLRGIQTPGGQWLFPERQVAKAKARRQLR